MYRLKNPTIDTQQSKPTPRTPRTPQTYSYAASPDFCKICKDQVLYPFGYTRRCAKCTYYNEVRFDDAPEIIYGVSTRTRRRRPCFENCEDLVGEGKVVNCTQPRLRLVYSY